MYMCMCMSLHVILLYPHGAQERGSTGSVYGLCCCRAVSAAVRPLCAVGLSGSCQAVTLGPDSDGSPRLSGSAVRLSDTCCQTVRESAVSAVRLSGTVRRCPGFAVRLSDQGSGPTGGPAHAQPCPPLPTRLDRSADSSTSSTTACRVMKHGDRHSHRKHEPSKGLVSKRELSAPAARARAPPLLRSNTLDFMALQIRVGA